MALILGLDTSKNRTGYAWVDGMEVWKYGHIDCPKGYLKVTQSDPEFADFLFWYKEEIKGILYQYSEHLAFVAMEDLNIRFAPTAKVMLQVQAAAKLAVREYMEGRTNINLLHNMTVKSKFGMARPVITREVKKTANQFKVKPVKVLMVDEVNKIFNLGLSYEENDEADAIALAWCLGKEVTTTLAKG